MRLLIDTFNVLHVTGILPPGLAGPDVRGLADLIAASRWKTAQVALVCDGTPPPSRPALEGQMRAIYSGPREADEILERLIADSTAPKGLLVVSSDRRIRRAARRRNAAHLDSPAFLRCLLEDRRQARLGLDGPVNRPSTLRPGEAASWRDLFGLGDAGLPPVGDEDLPIHLQRHMDPPPAREKVPSPAASPEASTPPPAPDPAAFLPQDLLREAQALLGDSDDPTEPTTGAGPAPLDPGTSGIPQKPPATPRVDSDLPSDLIKEAEDLLRNFEDPEDPGR